MKWALVTTALVGLLIALGSFGPLTDLTPAFAAITRTIDALETELSSPVVDPEQWPEIREQVELIQRQAQETDRLLRLLAGIEVYLDFERSLNRLAAAAAAEDAASASIELSDLKQLWRSLLSF